MKIMYKNIVEVLGGEGGQGGIISWKHLYTYVDGYRREHGQQVNQRGRLNHFWSEAKLAL